MDSQTPNSNNTSSTEQKESKESYYDSLRKEAEDSYQRLKKLEEEDPNPMELKSDLKVMDDSELLGT